MRLEGEHEAPAREGAARGRERRRHLDRVVAVVVDQREAAGAVRAGMLAVALEAAADAVELGQALDHRRVGQLELGGDGDRRQRVQHVVHAGQVQRDREVGHAHAVAALHGEAHRAGVGDDVDGAHMRVGAEAVGDERARDHRQDRAHVGVVDAEDGGAVERHPVDEVDEGLLQLREVVAVGVHVVGVDVGDDRHHRQQVQERRVGLVGLDDDVVAGAEPRVGAGGVEPAADDEGRVEAGLGEHAGDERGRRRLAVRAGDGDALLQAHQLGQHHRARHDRDALGARGDHFGVVALHRGRRDDRVGAGDVRGVVADRDAGCRARPGAAWSRSSLWSEPETR